MTPTIRLALRLSPDEQAALATVAGKIASPLRRTPTASDALRAAVLFAAGAMPAAVAIGTAATRK